MAWWNRLFGKGPENLISISDPALAQYFGVGSPNYSGVTVSEPTALSIAAVYRCVSLIAGTISTLPLRTYRDTADGIRQRFPSFLDDPGAVVGTTRYEWTETVLAHLLLHGNAYLMKVRNQGGGTAGLIPVHPQSVSIEYRPGVDVRKTFRVTLDDGTTRVLTTDDLLHIPALSTDGVYGYSPIAVARNSFGTQIAGDRAAARAFNSGATISGLVVPEEDLTEAEAKAITEGLNQNIAGYENAGRLAVINRKLKFQPWQMSLKDAMFLESRQFGIQEIARWYGVPANLLMDPGSVSTWGTGVEIQNRGLARYTLQPWTTRIEQKLSTLLPMPRFCEYDYAGLIKPDPETEIRLLIEEVNAGLITPNEARRIRGLDPITGGDELRTSGQALTSEPADLDEVPA